MSNEGQSCPPLPGHSLAPTELPGQEKADLFAHNVLIISTSCERVWTTYHPKRPGGRPGTPTQGCRNPAAGIRCSETARYSRWTTFGLAIRNRVHEYVSNQRLGWYGYAPGAKPSFYHSWYLEPQGAMCHVVMDEAGVGKDAAGLRKSDETLMHRGHDLWLATLNWVAEAP